MSVRTQRAFTLVELLVVISILMLLVSLLVPSVGRGIEMSRRAACMMNTRELARACKIYALNEQEHRGSPARELPAVVPAGSNWAAQNAAGLFLLIKYRSVAPGSFICPSVDDAKAGALAPGDTVFTQFSQTSLSYSYQSMIGGKISLAWTQLYPSLALVADDNPRVNFDGLLSPLLAKTEHARAHQSMAGVPEGQNVGFLDESAKWLVVPKVTTRSNQDDWIYAPKTGDGGDGKSTYDYNNPNVPFEDVYLIP